MHSSTSSTYVNENLTQPTSEDTLNEPSATMCSKGWFSIPNALVDNFSVDYEAISLLIFMLRQSKSFILRDSYLLRRMGCEQKKLERLFKSLRVAGYVKNVPLPKQGRAFTGSKRIFSAFPEFLDMDQCKSHSSIPMDPCNYGLVHKDTTDNKKTSSLQPLKNTNVEQARSAPIADIEKVFQHWQEVMGHPRAVLDPGRSRLIAKSLKSHGLETCIKAIDGCWRTPHNMGNNDTGTIYDSIGLIFRSADKIEGFARNFDQPPVIKLKEEHWTDKRARQNVEGFERGQNSLKRLIARATKGDVNDK